MKNIEGKTLAIGKMTFVLKKKSRTGNTKMCLRENK
jgi:hypothetical protein